MRVLEHKGIRYEVVWTIGQQIVKALNYLHSLDITHRDLKPDNILLEVGPRKIVVKLADFGLAVDARQGISIQPHEQLTSSREANVRWGAPEVFDKDHPWTLEKIKAADMYCFGSVLAYALTGWRPYDDKSTNRLGDQIWRDRPIPPDLPPSLHGCLRDVVLHCMKDDPDKRPTAAVALKQYFSQENNPYILEIGTEKEAAFFTCGFMDKTDIVVADSCTDQDTARLGFYLSGKRPLGYDHRSLQGKIEVKNAPYRYTPIEYEKQYKDYLAEFLDLSKRKVIDNNPTVALKGLSVSSVGQSPDHCIMFDFKQSDYVHHRAMRKIWTELSNYKKQIIRKQPEVVYDFSNTFGLHVAVLTNEGPDKPQKFLFPRRAQRAGMSSPGSFTCGAVESASKPDFIQKDKNTFVDLVNTAARGLQEELGLELSGTDLQAICLTTIYLKLDTHEWGLCGFVDLKDDRVDPSHRLSAESLKDIFSSGPKDKFEHQSLYFVEFNLDSMVDFVFQNHENFASSAKLVVVKVLEAFFGWQKVHQEFQIKL